MRETGLKLESKQGWRDSLAAAVLAQHPRGSVRVWGFHLIFHRYPSKEMYYYQASLRAYIYSQGLQERYGNMPNGMERRLKMKIVHILKERYVVQCFFLEREAVYHGRQVRSIPIQV